MPAETTWHEAAGRLTAALHLDVAPIAITFSNFGGGDARPFADRSTPMPEPTVDGRTGRVSAGCVFWVHALNRTFATRPEDHGNCSVGSLTHGLIDLETARQRADVGASSRPAGSRPKSFLPYRLFRPGHSRSCTDRWLTS